MRKTMLFTLCVLVVGLGGCARTPQPQIAFQGVDENGNYQIYLVDLDGDNLIQLTDVPYSDGWPVWSPDGQQIVFYSGRDFGEATLYLMNADGNDVRRFTDGNAPSWSPDGEWIAFGSNRDGDVEIYIQNVITNEVIQLTENEDIRDEFPSWSPDGHRIVYESGIGGMVPMEIVMMDVDGSNREVLISDFGYISYPQWSPLGNSILFSSGSGDASRDIFILDLTTREIEQVTNGEKAYGANWSPDGERIIFTTTKIIGVKNINGVTAKLETQVLFVINADGIGLMEIPIEGVESPAGGAWRP